MIDATFYYLSASNQRWQRCTKWPNLSKIAMFRIFKHIPTLWTVNNVFPKPFYLLYQTECCQQNLRKLHVTYLCDFRNTSATLFNV